MNAPKRWARTGKIKNIKKKKRLHLVCFNLQEMGWYFQETIVKRYSLETFQEV